MAKYNKVKWSVSITPLVHHEAVDGENLAIDVINENIRKTLYSSGEVSSYNGVSTDVWINEKASPGGNIFNRGIDNAEGFSGWENGNHWYVSSQDTLLGWDTGSDFVVIKNTGYLYDLSSDYQLSNTKGSSTDTVKIILDVSASVNVVTSGSTDSVLAELAPGEAMIFPRPGSGLAFSLESVNNHMAVEVTIIGT